MTLEESKKLDLSQEYNFFDKNKNIKKLLAANFESIADKITVNLQSDQRENFHEFLCAYVDIFTRPPLPPGPLLYLPLILMLGKSIHKNKT